MNIKNILAITLAILLQTGPSKGSQQFISDLYLYFKIVEEYSLRYGTIPNRMYYIAFNEYEGECSYNLYPLIKEEDLEFLNFSSYLCIGNRLIFSTKPANSLCELNYGFIENKFSKEFIQSNLYLLGCSKFTIDLSLNYRAGYFTIRTIGSRFSFYKKMNREQLAVFSMLR